MYTCDEYYEPCADNGFVDHRGLELRIQNCNIMLKHVCEALRDSLAIHHEDEYLAEAFGEIRELVVEGERALGERIEAEENLAALKKPNSRRST